MVESTETFTQYYAGNFYFWKIFSQSEPAPLELLKSIKEIGLKLETNFFKIARGKTEDLESECKECLNALIRLIPNLKFDHSDFISTMVRLFNDFYSEIMEFNRDKFLLLLEKTKSNYNFSPIYKRILFKDKTLADEEARFLTELFEIHEFRSETVIKKFISYFKGFITGFDTSTEAAIKEFILRTEEEVVHTTNMFVATTKRKISNYFKEKIENFKFMRVVVRNFQVNISDEEQRKDWATAYEGIFLDEEVKLRQIVSVSSNSVIIGISFEESNQLFIVYFQDFAAFPVKKLISDKETVVAEGSDPNHLVLFKNTEKVCILGYFQEFKVLETMNEISFFSKNSEKIVSASYFKQSKEIIFLTASGIIGYKSIDDKNNKDLSIIKVQNIKSVVVSYCGKYF